uniref:Cysteine protease n=1 Tax=Myotis myotis TaxID=51298 RepID=A0A7J7WFR4_MYOMY|nr:autophagy related 4B cysteine peptidase [Myotis myotis]
MDAATLTYDTLRFAEFEDFPETSEPVWILGRKYSVFTEKDEILSDVASRLWFTYRKNFPAIGRLCRSSLPCAEATAFPADSEGHCNGLPAGAEVTNRPSLWRPLVLLIPLRLGLTDINEAYVETLKGCFMMPQSLGVIGGKPNSAHYFIGYVGEELIYLDPHTTQPAVEFTDSFLIPDESFHCQHPPSRMSIGELDPSIAVGFFCKTEDDFNDWCQQVKKLSLLGGALPMFELVEQQPSHLACPDVLNLSLDSSDVERLERFFDSEDEDFEILSL